LACSNSAVVHRREAAVASLFDYQQQTQRMLREKKQDLINPDDLIVYINRARREVAMRTKCIRVLTQISAPVMTASVVAGGTGYNASLTTVSITPPDFPSGTGAFPNGAQATATSIVQAGSIAAVDINYGGSGYFQPVASVTGPSGSGASVSLTTAPINQLNIGQEFYPWSGVYLGGNPGVKEVFGVQGISCIYANYRFSLPVYSFSVYQAMIRQYPFQYQYIPTFASQYGIGAAGGFFTYPLPSQIYQYELDCYCLPSDLTTNLDYEAIPDPYTDAVAYFSAHLGFLDLQNFNIAQFFLNLFEKQLGIYSHSVNIGRVSNPYGRW
jgi:hypothetical protein